MVGTVVSLKIASNKNITYIVNPRYSKVSCKGELGGTLKILEYWPFFPQPYSLKKKKKYKVASLEN